jgi:predicted Holliday junction resolvase-like endonuclease
MNSEINSIEFEAIRVMQSHLSKRGLRVSQRKLMDSIYELLAKNESEILLRIDKKKNYELKLKKWLESPIETKRTDALEEHDLVV